MSRCFAITQTRSLHKVLAAFVSARQQAKTFSAALLAFCCTVALSGVALAETWTDANGVEWTYSITDGKAKVGLDGTTAAIPTSTEGDVVVPSELGGCPVTSISSNAFRFCSGLTSVVIPEGVADVGKYAFSGCSHMTDVTMPDSLLDLGHGAFWNCLRLTNVVFGCGIGRIPGYAFNSCRSLERLDIPASVTNIASTLIEDCSSFSEFAISNDNSHYKVVDGVLYTKDGATLVRVPSTSAGVTIPESVKTIGNEAFRGCTNVTRVVIPDGVTSIGNHAFNGCRALASVTIPASATDIGTYAFCQCNVLEGVDLPQGVKSIGQYAFSGCKGIESLEIPESVTNIGMMAFSGSSGLKSIVVPSGVASIGSYAFCQCDSLETVKIESAANIGDYAFYYCKNLSSVTLPDNVAGIGLYAFWGCANMTEVTFPVSVTNIRAYAFLECTSLKTVVFEGCPDAIGNYAFYKCTGIDTVYARADDIDYIKDRLEASKLSTEGITFAGYRERIPAGEYFKATLVELGYDVPTNGTSYSVVAKGLPSGLKLKYNAANKKKKIKAKSSWWIEGVPTAAVDFLTNPAYLTITANGTTETLPLMLPVAAQDVTKLDDMALGQTVNASGMLTAVGKGWTVSGLPTGLKFATKKTTAKIGSKKVTVAAYSVYGKTTKAGLFNITAKKKKGSFYETLKFRVMVMPKAVNTAVFTESLTNITTMAYVPIAWNLATGEAIVPSVLPVPFVPSSSGGKLTKVSGLPTGLTFAAKDTYAYTNAKKKTGKYLKQSGQTIVGTPTKPGTYVVTFTKKVKKVTKTAQIVWTIVPNDADLSLGFNTKGGVVESGTAGLAYTNLLAFTATAGATVTPSGLPKGITLAGDKDSGNWAFSGFTTKAGTYLVTVKATLNGNTVTQRLALKVDGLPSWAKGTFNGYVEGADGATNGLSTITVSSVGKISGKFQELGTNWTISAASYTDYDAAATNYTAAVTAKYAYKYVTKNVNGKKQKVPQYKMRYFTLTVSSDALGGVAVLEEVDGSAVHTWQNLWGSTYKAVGKELFYTSKKAQYKEFPFDGATPEGAALGLTAQEKLTLKVTVKGVVTATMIYDTGKKKKGKTVYYKPTCSTVVIPTTAPDADPFEGVAFVYFAPSLANGFAGFVSCVQF